MFNNGALASWDRQSDVGPVPSEMRSIVQWSDPWAGPDYMVITNGGRLTLNDKFTYTPGATNATFGVGARAPAPGAVALLGLAGLAGGRRRR